MRFYIAINSYRTVTSDGGWNTWEFFTVSREDQQRLLNEGLSHDPRTSGYWLGSDGRAYRFKDNTGIRLLTPSERGRWARSPESEKITSYDELEDIGDPANYAKLFE